MAITGITTDYSGRKRDIFINFGINPLKVGSQKVSMTFGTTSTSCAGVQKLIQRYMIIFLTLKGSQENFPDFGSNFLKNAKIGGNISSSTLSHYINFANFETVKIIKNYQADNNLPVDEQLANAILDGISINSDTVSIRIKLITNAGENVSFLIPLPI